MKTTYNGRLAGLMIAIHDYYNGVPFPEEIRWFLPYIREAIFSPDGNEWLCALLDYVARECGVPLPQEEEHGKRAS